MRGTMVLLLAAAAVSGCKTQSKTADAGSVRVDSGVRTSDAGIDGGSKGPDAGTPVGQCPPGSSSGAVAAPVFVRNLPGETGWFAPPVVADLDGDGHNELIVSAYATRVYSADGGLLDTASDGANRVYPPTVVGDLEGDGRKDLVVGRGKNVLAYEWRDGALQLKPGWPVDTTTAGNAPEVRGLAAADLGGDGVLRVIATTTQTAETSAGGAQVFVFNPDGTPYHPSARPTPDWPRYNALTGPGNDADRNDAGHVGYGCYGLNVGVGELDDDDALELVVTYDNHAIQLFNHDGVAVDLAPVFTNPASAFRGSRLTWGQMTRWTNPQTEDGTYRDHAGFPNVNAHERLQWTQSPPTVADLDGDGRAEVISAPNSESGEPYLTVAFALMVLEGAEEGGDRSGMRKPGWETLPRGATPMVAHAYPPIGVPAPVVVDLDGSPGKEIVVSLNDGYVSAYGADAQRRWRVDLRHGRSLMYAAEPVVADLNQDGSPEIIVATYGAPTSAGSGFLMVLGANGQLLHDVALPGQRTNGNGIGVAAAPTVADLDRDGDLEILLQSFDHGVDVFSVPGSGTRCLLWPTARGGLLRQGRGTQSETAASSSYR